MKHPTPTPTQAQIRSFGLLAYVAEHERNRVLALDAGNRARYMGWLEKRLRAEGVRV